MELHRRNFLGALLPKEKVALDISDEPSELSSDGYLLELSRKAMGCQFTAYTPARAQATAVEAIMRGFDDIQRLEELLSIYQPQSFISRINLALVHEKVAVPAEVLEVLQASLRISSQTSGAFDVTAGALSALWGFHRRQGRIPVDCEIARVLPGVGSTMLQIDEENSAVSRSHSQTQVDLGAIGKGYAIDQAAAVIRSSGLTDFLLHGGSSTVWGEGNQAIPGAKPSAEMPNAAPDKNCGWLVQLRHPLFPQRLLAQVRLHNQSLSTSGSAVQSFIYQGQRYGHIIDPRIGYPADKVISTTVIAPSATLSDALATACYILGPDEARAVLEHFPEATAIFVAPGDHVGTVNVSALGKDNAMYMA